MLQLQQRQHGVQCTSARTRGAVVELSVRVEQASERVSKEQRVTDQIEQNPPTR
jgi:hypothetical protein